MIGKRVLDVGRDLSQDIIKYTASMLAREMRKEKGIEKSTMCTKESGETNNGQML